MTRREALKLLADARYADDLQGNDNLQTAHNMAMEALKQEPCEDAISRQAVIELAKKGVLVSNRNFESVCKAINDLPSVTPIHRDRTVQDFADNCRECGARYGRRIKELEVVREKTEWIPVSDRLPEPNETDGLTARFYLIQNEYEDMLVARYDGKGWEQIYQYEYLEDEVIAWMSLPEPYKAESEAENGTQS